jgi:hypothetical protein
LCGGLQWGNELGLATHRPREGAVYIAELASDLARLARESGLLELAYLLDIARLEAEMAASHTPPPARPDRAK